MKLVIQGNDNFLRSHFVKIGVFFHRRSGTNIMVLVVDAGVVKLSGTLNMRIKCS